MKKKWRLESEYEYHFLHCTVQHKRWKTRSKTSVCHQRGLACLFKPVRLMEFWGPRQGVMRTESQLGHSVGCVRTNRSVVF